MILSTLTNQRHLDRYSDNFIKTNEWSLYNVSRHIFFLLWNTFKKWPENRAMRTDRTKELSWRIPQWIAACKGIQVRTSWILDSTAWNPDSGFRIPTVSQVRISWAVIRIPKPSISDSTRKTSRIVKSEFPYVGWLERVPQRRKTIHLTWSNPGPRPYFSQFSIKDNRGLKQRRFKAMHLNRNSGILPFDMP